MILSHGHGRSAYRSVSVLDPIYRNASAQETVRTGRSATAFIRGAFGAACTDRREIHVWERAGTGDTAAMSSAADAAEWPAGNNFHALVPGTAPELLAEAFGRAGWGVGKASWFEYMVSNDWAEMTFSPTDGVLVAGEVARGRYADAVAVFTAVGFPCVADPEEMPVRRAQA
jgi:hypothetical protein